MVTRLQAGCERHFRRRCAGFAGRTGLAFGQGETGPRSLTAAQALKFCLKFAVSRFGG